MSPANAPRARPHPWSCSLAVLATGQPAHAAEPAHPQSVECIAGCVDGQPRGGSLLLVSGTGLGNVYTAVFPGGRDGIRDLRGRAGQTSTTAVRVRVPWEAASGGFVLGTRDGMVSRARSAADRARAGGVEVALHRPVRARAARSRAGSLVLVRGLRLGAVRDAVLHGGRGRADDLRARVSNQRFASFRMRVPGRAVTGTFSARERRRRLARPQAGRAGARRRCPWRRARPPACSRCAAHTRFGGAASRFGAGRSGHTHQGQDVMAACGVPLASATAGTVQTTGYQSSAGNYLVIRGTAPVQDYVYMHLPGPAGGQEGRGRGRRASRSAPWGRPATPRAAICTSRSGAHRAGTTAARRSTRCPSCRPGRLRASAAPSLSSAPFQPASAFELMPAS